MSNANRTETRPTLIMTAGSPGAGKGYTIERMHPTLPVVDCDQFKMAHPDYDPKNPAALHAWSSEQAQHAFSAALLAGETFIYDGTGANVEKMATMIKAAHAAGFKVQILYVKVRLTTALARNAARERVVPESLLREKFNTVETAIEILANYADEIVTVEND